MLRIYGFGDDPVRLLVAEGLTRRGETTYDVVNGGWQVEPIEDDLSRMRMHRKHLSPDDPEDWVAPKMVYTLSMEWGPTLRPSDSRVELLPKGTIWDYNEVLHIARKLLDESDPLLTWAERMEADAQARNPAPPVQLLDQRPNLLCRALARVRGIA